MVGPAQDTDKENEEIIFTEAASPTEGGAGILRLEGADIHAIGDFEQIPWAPGIVFCQAAR